MGGHFAPQGRAKSDSVCLCKAEGLKMISWMKSTKSTKPMKSRVAERGQVVIPKPLRDRLGVRPGTVLEFMEERGRLIAVKADGHNPTRRVWGCLGKNFDTDTFISEIRGKR